MQAPASGVQATGSLIQVTKTVPVDCPRVSAYDPGDWISETAPTPYIWT
uniref:Uncharacterized protein n=1 Tax=Fagus sylvatica TaxID=28930 RepID=A0A2N9I387_FAGSY